MYLYKKIPSDKELIHAYLRGDSIDRKYLVDIISKISIICIIISLLGRVGYSSLFSGNIY